MRWMSAGARSKPPHAAHDGRAPSRCRLHAQAPAPARTGGAAIIHRKPADSNRWLPFLVGRRVDDTSDTGGSGGRKTVNRPTRGGAGDALGALAPGSTDARAAALVPRWRMDAGAARWPDGRAAVTGCPVRSAWPRSKPTRHFPTNRPGGPPLPAVLLCAAAVFPYPLDPVRLRRRCLAHRPAASPSPHRPCPERYLSPVPAA